MLGCMLALWIASTGHVQLHVYALATRMSLNAIVHREGFWQLRSIFRARLLHPANTTQPYNAKRVLCHALSLLQSQSGEVALVRESDIRLSLTASPR